MPSRGPLLIDFRVPTTLAELAQHIGIDETSLISATKPDKTDYLFTKHRIPKRGKHRVGEHRIVWEADPELADVFKSFARRFDLFMRVAENRYPHPSAFGYVRGKSTIDNAIRHCGAPLILHADIANFFPSISSDRLLSTFRNLGINRVVSKLLVDFLTIDNSLPLGLHPSPMLANVICLDLDDKFSKLASDYECCYTRYADDITLSGKHCVPDKEQIQMIMEREHFRFSETKFRITKRGQAHYVTGLSVSDPRFPRAPRTMKRNIRQTLYYCRKYGIHDHLLKIGYSPMILQQGVNRIDGFVNYIAHIEKEALPRLREEWNDLLTKEGLEVSYETIKDRKTRIINYYVDETNIHCDGTIFLALCFVEIEDIDYVNLTTESILRQHIANPFSGGHKNNLVKKKLHYTDCTEDLRKTYIDKLSTLPFRAYLAYGQLESQGRYEDLYLSLITKVLPHRLMGCDRAVVRIIFEENGRIESNKIKKIVDSVYSSLCSTNNRRPFVVETVIGGKTDHPCFSVPDFLLGIFSGYASPKVGKNERRTLFFENLRDRYRIILDTDNNIVFSRKRPFIPWC